MRVSSIDLFHLRLPLVRPFEISSGRLTNVSTILVRLSGEGEEGWGEAPPWDEPIYGPETAQTAFHIIRDVLAPRVVGRRWDTPEALAALLSGFRGNFFAKAALETAWWVLEARLRKIPLHRLPAGGSTASSAWASATRRAPCSTRSTARSRWDTSASRSR